MQHATIEYPDKVRLSLNLPPEQFIAEVRMAAAVKLFELERLSSGRAADIASVSRIHFLHPLSTYGVATFAMDEDEVMHDIANAKPV